MIATKHPQIPTEAYWSSFAAVNRPEAEIPNWLRELRGAAFHRFRELGFPTTRHEEWRFTDITPVAATEFELTGPSADELELDAVAPFLFGGELPRLVFVNGRHSARLSWLPRLPRGVTAESLGAAITSRPDAVRAILGRYAAYKDVTFTALNTALVQDGAYIRIPEGVAVEEPIHVLHVATEANARGAFHPRHLLVLERQAQATVIESYVGLNGGAYFTNAVTEIVLSEDAVLAHCKLQQERADAYHIATTQVHQSARSRFSSHYFSLGGKLVRSELNTVLAGEGCDCTLSGLYLASGRQHVDNCTRIDHAKPRCVSFELYKGILDERAKGVFNGKIYVHPDAQKTDAKQSNQVLLLSDDAVIDAKPQLQIYADDVRCTHGATVGQLDEQALFYLRSRGISQALARSLLIYAFANEIVEGLMVEPVRAYLQRLLLADQSLPDLSGA